MTERFLLALIFGAAIAAASYRARFLSVGGGAATFCLAVIIFGFGGWKWTVPILTFFLLSSLLTKFGGRQKAELEDVFEKGSVRDAGQVAANGGVPGILVILSFLFPQYEFFPLYLGSIAAVTADTWGTEIGVLSRRTPILILSGRPVPAGTSGGVTEAGVLGGVLGAAVIALSGCWWVADFRSVVWIVVAGVAGSAVDSILGAIAQVQYRCAVCGKATERKVHCGRSTERVRGIPWLTNDAVNWFCAVAGAAGVWLLEWV